MTKQRYCSKCARKLIDNHCPVHLTDMIPIDEDDTVTITVKELNELYNYKEGN